MKTKRVLLALLAGLLVISSTGCGNGEKQAASDNGAYNIVWYNGFSPSDDNDLVFEEISKLTMEKINATVTAVPIQSADYAEKIKMLIAANEKMDLVYMNRGNGYVTLAAQKAFLPVDDLLKSHGQDILNLIPDYIFDGAKYQGKIYAVPVLKDWPHEPVLRYNTMMTEKYNFDMESVKSLADLTPMLQTIKDNEPDWLPILNRGDSPLFKLLPFENISGSSIAGFKLDDYSKIINKFDTDEAREYFKLMRDWYQKGFIKKDAATATNDTEWYQSGKFFAAYSESLPYLEDQINLNVAEHKLTKFLHGIVPPQLGTFDVQGCMNSISALSKNPEKTMEFLNLLYTDKEIKNMVNLGIEGKHYVAVGENQYDFPEGVTKSSETGYDGVGYESMVGNRFLSRIRVGIAEDIWEKYKEFNESAVVSEALGFVFDAAPVINQITALENVYSEYMPSLLVGAVDPEEVLPKALEKMKVAGIDAVLEEMNNQYQAWKANK